ncbi:MAG TPA: YIP1 family protein [Candidatus Acidoferrum sp.]
MTELQRLAGIVISPRKTFEDIQQRPTWILPVALLLVFHLLGDFVLFRVVITDANFDQLARAKVQGDAGVAGRQNSPAEEAQQIDTLRRERVHWYFFTLIAVPLSLLVLSLFFYIVLRLTGTDVTFPKVLVVVCWTSVIYRCIGGAFTITTLLVRGPANFFPGPSEAWSPTSIAQLVPRSAVSPKVYSSLVKLDIFLVWWLAVLSIGFAKISKNLSLAKSGVLVAVCEVIYLLVNAFRWPR